MTNIKWDGIKPSFPNVLHFTGAWAAITVLIKNNLLGQTIIVL